jgi:hypothetical protein
MAAPAYCCQAIRRGPCIRAAVKPRPWPPSQNRNVTSCRRLSNPTLQIPQSIIGKFPNQLLTCPIFAVGRVAGIAIPGPVKPGPGIISAQLRLRANRHVIRRSSHVQNQPPHARPDQCRWRRLGALRRNRCNRTTGRYAGIGNRLRGERRAAESDCNAAEALNKLVGEHTAGEDRNVS